MSYDEDVSYATSKFQSSAKAKADHVTFYKHLAAAAEAYGVKNGAAAALASLGTDPNNALTRFSFSGADPVGSINAAITANTTLAGDSVVTGNPSTAGVLVTATGNALSAALTAAKAGKWLDAQKQMGKAVVAASAADTGNSNQIHNDVTAGPHSATVIANCATASTAVGYL